MSRTTGKRTRIKHSFAAERDEEGNASIDVAKVAKILAKNWGDIPKTLNDTRALEIHCLALAYLKLRKRP